MNGKRLLYLTLVMVVGIAGIAFAAGQADTPTSAGPMVVTITRVTNPGGQFAPGETTTDNGELKAIEKLANIKFKILWEAAPADYKQKIALNIASGDMPDVFPISEDYPTFKQLALAGKLADLTKAYKENVTGLAAEHLKSVDLVKLNELATFNGKLYGLSSPADGYNYDLLWLRQDWLKKVGLPLPKTLDDVEKVALAFIQQDPGGNGPGKTLGIPVIPPGQGPDVNILGRSDTFFSISAVAHAVGAIPDRWIIGKDGKVTWGAIEPEMKKALEVAARWYKEGILDRQFVTYKNVDAVTPFIATGQAGMCFMAWWGGWVTAPIQQNHPEADWIPVLAPLDANGKFVHTNHFAGFGNYTVVNAKFKRPDLIVKAMTADYNAVRGQYQGDPEIKALLEPSRKLGALGRTISPFSGNWIANQFDVNPRIAVSLNSYLKSGNPKDIAWMDEGQKANMEGAAKYFKSKDRSDAGGASLYYSYAVAANLLNDPANKDVAMFQVETPSMADLKPQLDTLQQQAEIQIITGEKPLAYFDEFVAQWRKAGGDKLISEVQAIVGKK